MERFASRAAAPWFRHEDLLVAHDDRGRIVGVHWTKRRSADVGEVYNLAVHPDARGKGVGAALLAAGFAHLAAAGMLDVLLWVDLANERALRLYVAHGFTLRWEDVLLRRTTAA
jgi:mycothiol synthase